jgi:hypothetical protein
MQIDHPILVIGLGGTGGKFGAELERRLRQEICGPDGRKWIDETGFDRDPHQLPSCLQFIYVDIDQRDLARLTEPPADLKVAYGRTRHTVSDLLPALDSYALVSQYLHTRAEDQVRHFLPPAVGEPRVAPLSRGAGQLPTIARACLFAKIRQAGMEKVQAPINEAVTKLRDCAVDLDSLGGVNARSCDVFIAFSVAGGTGNGMFYDYIHLVSDAFSRTTMTIQVYPLVVLPSAFPEGSGGGRNARLNAGRGLLDLARLVDDQNMRGANPAYRPTATQRPDEHGVTYREEHGSTFIQMAPSTLQTAYLFSNDGGLPEAQLHSSIASFVMSMAGVRMEAGARDGHNAGLQSTEINQGVNRQVLSLSGIGGRGMSSAFVTSLTVPRAGIVELFTTLLLATAIDDCSRPEPGEDSGPLYKAFLEATGLTRLVTRPYLGQQHGSFLPGASQRGQRAMAEVEHHKTLVQAEVTKMARGFIPRDGLEAAVRDRSAAHRHVSPFQVERAIFGGAGAAAGASLSAVTFLRRIPVPPAPLTGKEKREHLAKWRESAAQEAWTTAWQDQSGVWELRLKELSVSLRQLTSELDQFVRTSRARASQDLAEILDDNGTAHQFAHDLPRDPEDFYLAFAARLLRSLGLPPGTPPEALLTALLGDQGPWTDLTLDATDPGISVRQAVRDLQNRVTARILERATSDPTLLPHLADLIAPGAHGKGLPGAEAVHNALRGLVPTGALLSAAGPARAIITYPVHVAERATHAGDGPADGASGSMQAGGSRATRDPEVEAHLRQTIDIGAPDVIYDFRATSTETVTVVLTRTALGIMDIPEARRVMALWAEALRLGTVKDHLRWRQRLGYDFTWLLTTEEQRVSILQRLLIAMRNGQVDVLDGTEERPLEIAIRASAIPGSSAARLELPLQSWSGTSPWADLLHAYEESVFAGDELNRQQLYAAIMELQPLRDRATGEPAGSSGLYKTFLRVQQDELARLQGLLGGGKLDPDHRLQVEGLLGFWAQTVPAALGKRIEGFNNLANTLDDLG